MEEKILALLESLVLKVDKLEFDMNRRFDEVDRRFDEVDKRFDRVEASVRQTLDFATAVEEERYKQKIEILKRLDELEAATDANTRDIEVLKSKAV